MQCLRREAFASRGDSWSKFGRVDHSTLEGPSEKLHFCGGGDLI